MEQKHPLDDYIQSKIKEILNNHDESIKAEDARIIIQNMIPEINKIVSRQIKLHLKIIAEYLIDTFKEKEENKPDA